MTTRRRSDELAARALLPHTAPRVPRTPSTEPGSQDSDFQSSLLEEGVGDAAAPAEGWTRRRSGALFGYALLGLAGIAVLVWMLARSPHLDARWRATEQGEIELVRGADATLSAHENTLLVGVTAEGSPTVFVDAGLLRRSARWTIDDLDRAAQLAESTQLAEVLQHPTVTLHFADGTTASVQPRPRAWERLPLTFWLLCGFAFAIYLVAAASLLRYPHLRSRLYVLMAWCQSGNLLMIAIEATVELGVPEPFARIDLPLRTGLDLATAAAMVASVCLYPHRLPGAPAIASALSLAAAGLFALLFSGVLPQAWWWTQIGVAVYSLIAVALLSWSYRLEANPFALVLRRFGVVAVATWALLTAALASAHVLQQLPYDSADLGSMVWYVFLGSLLLLAPFLARTHTALREFALLAAISTVATSLHLLFVAMGTFSAFGATTLSLLVSLAVYSVARQWLLTQLLGGSRLTTEHMFEQLYRVARQVEAEPHRTPALLARLIGDLFKPLEIRQVERRPARTRVASDGSSLLVPLPLPPLGSDPGPYGGVLMRFAQGGRRLFSAEDARLTDRIVEQLQRAVTFDRAVEQGRHEERLRLAQDLHDDIGARLLTLMYQARSPEVEEYVRHTLQDLKTLTRGLAASEHRLSHSAGEWKADLTHRLTAAQIEVNWKFVYDDDMLLTVGQWSALTRVLRELVSNCIAHAKATCLEIDFRMRADQVDLTVSDDGIGRDPGALGARPRPGRRPQTRQAARRLGRVARGDAARDYLPRDRAAVVDAGLTFAPEVPTPRADEGRFDGLLAQPACEPDAASNLSK